MGECPCQRQKAIYKSLGNCDSRMEKSVIIDFPVLIKSELHNEKRIITLESSNESVDGEGDVILQKALMDSSETFIKNGHLDIDHLSEIGRSMGITNPSQYIVGVPLEVFDMGEQRTGVKGELFRNPDGTFDPDKYQYDMVWHSLQLEPPVRWRASIYGFPKSGMVKDCSKETCGTTGATRYLVEGLDWRSLALTKNPMNDQIKHEAKIVTAKAYAEAFLKQGDEWEDIMACSLLYLLIN